MKWNKADAVNLAMQDCMENPKDDFERLVDEYWQEMQEGNNAEDTRNAINLLKEIETRNVESISRWMKNGERVVA